MQIDHAVGSLGIPRSGHSSDRTADAFGNFQIERDIGQSDFGQQFGIVLPLLPFGQSLRLFDDADAVSFAQSRGNRRQPFPFRRRLFCAQFGIRSHRQPHPMRIVEQQLPGQLRDEIGITAFRP